MMSPVTATLKCPHGTGENTHGAEAAKAMACDEDVRERQDYLEGGIREDRGVLPAGQANWKSNP